MGGMLRSTTAKKIIFLLVLLYIVISFPSVIHLLIQGQISFGIFISHIALDGANPHFRIQLVEDGKCIRSSNGFNLEYEFCDPTQHHTFHFLQDGKLAYSISGLCVTLATEEIQPRPLKLGGCSTAASFRVVNESYLQLIDSSHGAEFCVSRKKIHGKSVKKRSEKSLVFSGDCIEILSRVNLLEENNFIARRKALLQPAPVDNPDCNFPACNINKRPPPVKLLPSSEVKRCYNLSECVTAVIKTARRPHLVLRLAQSIRDTKGYDIPMIAYDDGVGPYPDEMMSKIASFPNLQYIIGDKADLGISLGRTLAVNLVQTKYFLLFDDDIVVYNRTDIELLAEILDTTDASLVGGKFHGTKYFSGFFWFTSLDENDQLTSDQKLKYYEGACYHANETIPGFPSCTRCDTAVNFFMAKTADILEVGCWSEELKIMEHKDLFLRLKAAGKKVVDCPKVKVFNRGESGEVNKLSGFHELRVARARQMQNIFNNIWNVHKTFRIRKEDNETVSAAFLKNKNNVLN